MHGDQARLQRSPRDLARWQKAQEQLLAGNRSITGVMIESNLLPGNQKMAAPSELQYGVSITDACVGWDETAAMLNELNASLGQKAA